MARPSVVSMRSSAGIVEQQHQVRPQQQQQQQQQQEELQQETQPSTY